MALSYSMKCTLAALPGLVLDPLQPASRRRVEDIENEWELARPRREERD